MRTQTQVTIRVAIYLRSSLDRQEDSPERQLNQVRPYCIGKGYEIVEVYEDRGERGWDETRPSFQRLLRDAIVGRFRFIVCDEVSRLSRSDPVDFTALVVRPLRESGVLVDTVAEGIQDWNNLAGQLIGFIHQSKASTESSTLAYRVQSKFRMRAAEGIMYTGKPPYGYRREVVEKVPRLVPGPPAEVESVRLIFRLYADGHSLVGVSEQLLSRNIPSPTGKSRWRPNTLRVVLRDRQYVGTYLFNRNHFGRFSRVTADGIQKSQNKQKKKLENPPEDWTVIEGAHPAIIDRDLFDKVQHLLVSNRRHTTPTREQGKFLLSGLLRCPDCGSPMSGTHSGGKVRRVRYRCSLSVARMCVSNIVDEYDLVSGILGACLAWFAEPAYQVAIRAAALAMEQEQSGGTREESLRTERTDLLARITKATRNAVLLDDEATIKAVGEDVKIWRSRVAAIERELTSRQNPSLLVDDFFKELTRTLQGIQTTWASGDRILLRTLLREVLWYVTPTIERVTRTRITQTEFRLTGGSVFLRVPCDKLFKAGHSAEQLYVHETLWRVLFVIVE